MQVVGGERDCVHQVVDVAWVFALLSQHVDGPRVGIDPLHLLIRQLTVAHRVELVLRLQLVAIYVPEFYGVQTHIVAVGPRRLDLDRQTFAVGTARDLEVHATEHLLYFQQLLLRTVHLA